MSEGDPTGKHSGTLLDRQIAQILADHSLSQAEQEAEWDAREELLRRLNRIGEYIIFKSATLLRRVPQYRDAAVDSTLPNNRRVDEPIVFKIEDTEISVNFFPFDIPKRRKRMSLNIADGEHLEHFYVDTDSFLASRGDPDRRIEYWERIEDVGTKPVLGIRAALKGLRMLNRVRKLGRVPK